MNENDLEDDGLEINMIDEQCPHCGLKYNETDFENQTCSHCGKINAPDFDEDEWATDIDWHEAGDIALKT